jgi:hypothetical protein
MRRATLFPNQPSRSKDRHQHSKGDQDESKSKSSWVERSSSGHRATGSCDGEPQDYEQHTDAQHHPVLRHNKNYHSLTRTAASGEGDFATVMVVTEEPPLSLCKPTYQR